MGAETGRQHAAVIGYGNVGRMLGELLAGQGWHVTAIDPRAPWESSGDSAPDACVRADVGRPDPGLRRALATAGTVVVAVPERAALTTVDALDAYTAPDATIVETLSHKRRFREAARRRLAPRPLVSLNPLFHPSLGWAGNTVTASVERGGPTAARLLDLIGATGAHVHLLDPAEHDRYVTSVQAVTHAAVLGFAAALPHLGPPPADVIACAPPPARALLALAARMLTADAETYWDIQASGEPGDTARRALLTSIAELDGRVAKGADAAFGETFTRLRAWLGDDLEGLADDAAHLLGALVARRAGDRPHPTREHPSRPHEEPGD